MRNRFLYQNLPSYAPDGVGDGSSPTPAPPSPAPSPSPSPEPAPSAVPESPAAGAKAGEFDGIGGFDDDDGDTVIIESVPDPALAGAEGQPDGSPAPAPQATPAKVDPKAPPAPVPAAAPKEPVGATPLQASPAPAEPQGLVQQLDQHRDAVIAGLAAKEFALTKEEAEGLEIDPAKTVTQLMAKTYYRATQSALLHIQNFVPQMVVSMVKALQDQKAAEDAFYGKYSHLDRTKHAQDVNQFNGAFRTSNPSMQMDELLSMVAAAVTAKHGLVPGAPQAGGQPQPSPQPRVPSFVPARPGVGVRVTPEPESPFGGLGRDFDD